MIYFRDLFRRLRQSRRWVAAQFVLTILLILIGIVWTRLPEKHVWQVLLSLLLPLLVVISALELQAGTMRSLANDNGYRVKLVWGALALIFWFLVAWVFWAVLDWCDDQIPQWAGYLNSQTSAHWRAKFLTFEHISLWMSYVEWVFRWIIVPAKVIPFAIASAQSGWRVPLRRVLQLPWNWRWWLGVTIIALLSVLLPSHFFTKTLSGSPQTQVMHEALRLTGAYLLGVGGWLLLLAWAGVLFGCQKTLPENDALTELFDRLRISRRWVGAQFVWVILFGLVVLIGRSIPDESSWKDWVRVILLIVIFSLWIILQAEMMRSLLMNCGRRVLRIQGILSMLLWIILIPVIAFSLSFWQMPIVPWLVGLVVTPVILLPFVFASAVWGLILPWRRVLKMMLAWRWWLGILLTAIVVVLVVFISNSVFTTQTWVTELCLGAVNLLVMGVWILLLGWFAVLFNRTAPPASEKPAAIPVPVGPPEPESQASFKPPFPEGN